MISKIYFISGVNGVGKSSTIPYLKKLLPSNKYDVRDFDERGVPDGAGHAWRKTEATKWIEIGTEAAQKGISIIVCGFVKIKDFQDMQKENVPEIEIIVLGANAETIRNRLMARYTKNGVFDETQKAIGKPVNEFIESSVYYSKIMREESEKENLKIVDTSDISPEEVARKIIKIIEA